MADTTQPFIWNDFDSGIAASPHKGHGLMRNVDLDAFPGAATSPPEFATLFHTATSGTFTADAGTDICTLTGATVPATDTAVTLTTTGTLPAGLSTATVYFIIRVSDSTFKLATTIANAEAGTQINITDAGSGTHTVTTVNPGTIYHIVKDSTTSVKFFHDSNGRVWYLTSGGTRCLLLNGNTLTNSSGKGIVTFRNSDGSKIFLLAFRNALLDIVEITASANLQTPSWTNGWQNLNTGSGSSNSHHAIVGQDNIVYFCDGRYVGSLKELTIFAPADGGTFTYNSQALDLPQGEIAQWLEELGTNLMIAGNSYDKIYPWDRISDSYNLPLPVPEQAVKNIKNIGNILYILAGTKGNIFYSQGTYVKLFKRLPDYVTNNSGTISSNPITWGGIGAVQGKLIFGVSCSTTANSGVFKINDEGRLTIDNQPSTGAANVTAIFAENDLYTIGLASDAQDLGTSRKGSYGCVMQSDFRTIATNTEKGAYHDLEVIIAKPTATGSHIRVSHRTDTSSAFSTTYLGDFTTDGSTTVFTNDDIGLTDLVNLQLQCEYDGNVEIKEIRLLP